MSPRRADPELKPRLMQVAQELMLDGSFRAMSLRELCAHAAVSRGAFFHYFPSKEALAINVLEAWIEGFADGLRRAPYQTFEDPKDRLFGAIDHILSQMQAAAHKACLVGNLTQEMALHHPEIRALCARSFAQLTAYFRKLLGDAGLNNKPRAAELAEHFNVVFQGAIILAKAQQDPGKIGAHLALYKDLLEDALSQR